jgi:AraC family transcriptional activator of pobA
VIFNEALKLYFGHESLEEKGLPSVDVLADKLSLSTRYLSDLLKPETGKTAIELTHTALISEAKNLLRTNRHGVAEIAYQPGFENASHLPGCSKSKRGKFFGIS